MDNYIRPRAVGNRGATVAAAPAFVDIIVDCPYCGHAWKADPRWIASPCPECGRMVYRYMDPRHD